MSKVTYEIAVKTAKQHREGGTDADIFIQLVGENSSTTEWHKLDNFWRDDFKPGREDKFEIIDNEVGKILMLRLRMEHCIREDSWSCENIIVKHGCFVDEFPVYDWIFDYMEVLRGEALLPQKINSKIVRENIEQERAHNKTRYPWVEKSKPDDASWMLPRFIPAKDVHSVPCQLKMEDSRFEHMQACRNVVKFNIIIQKLKGMLFPIKKLDDYKNLFEGFRTTNKLQPYIERWEEDEEMGRQMLNGASPFAIERCVVLPDYCNIRNEHVKGLLNEGKTLEDEIADGRIFIADYSQQTKGLARNTQYKSKDMLYCPDVIALFYSPGNGKFLPVAIQLEPESEESIFTRRDQKYDWMLAKMHFRCADSNIHQWVYHFLWGHGIVETAASSMFRCLSRTHPMYKLCRAHLQRVVTINQFARDVLIFDNSPSNYTRSINGSALARNVFKNFDFRDLNFPELLKRKGLDSPKLENYHYRHDAMLLWDAIKKYLGNIIKIYYKTDQDVQEDNQMQDWAQDLAQEGFGWPDGDTRGCPTSLNTIDELIVFITSIVFTSTVQHFATHKPQFDLYKFVPNAPGGMRMPIHKRGEGTLQRVLDSLPDITMATILLGSAFVLTELPEEEVYIEEFPMRLFTEEAPMIVLNEFREDLKVISKKIKQRNSTIQYPYDALLPETLPSGTSA